MTTPAGPSHAPDAPSGRSTSTSSWFALAALTIGIFVMVTIEELPIGVLTLIADDLGATRGAAGLAVTVPGVLAGVVALATPLVIGTMDRRLVIVLSLASVVVSCLLSMIAPSLLTLLAARLFAGLAIGLNWSVLAVVAVRQVSAAHTGRALTIAFSGVGGALVLGVPFSTWIGTVMGWRLSFGVVGTLALLVLVAVIVLVRPVPASEAHSLGTMRRALRHRGIRYAIGLTALLITGQFVIYAYVSPMLQERADVPLWAIGPLLLAFGVAGLIGNFAIGPVLERSPARGVLIVSLGVACSLLLIAFVARSFLAAAVMMPIWGLFAGALSVTNQAFVTRESGEYEELGTALNSAAFNVAIALGALIGGRIVDLSGTSAALVTAIVIILAGVLLIARWLARPGQDRSVTGDLAGS